MNNIENEIEKLRLEVEKLKKELYREKKFSQSLLTSKSWTITKPLRSVQRLILKSRPLFSSQRSAATSNSSTAVSSSCKSSNPGEEFDPIFYKQAYPDVTGDPLVHYQAIGCYEGRLSSAPEILTREDLKCLDPEKENVLLVTHDASRSGVPILTANIAQCLSAKYNVFILPLLGGEMEHEFKAIGAIVLAPFKDAYDYGIASATLNRFLQQVTIKFAIANSIVSRSVLPAFAQNFIPCLCLVHEFTAYVSPKSAPLDVQFWASRMIFSARIVYENAAKYCPELADIDPVILPQGVTGLGQFTPGTALKGDSKRNLISHLPETPKDRLIILGVGTVEMRKGVDLFVACADRINCSAPHLNISFNWAGKGYLPAEDYDYSVFIDDHIDRADLAGKVHFLGKCENMLEIYASADVLLLPSRLDPLPNVAIEAMSAGVPVVCFDRTTGIADVLREHGLAELCVAPYLDVDAASALVINLLMDDELRFEVGRKCLDIAKNRFDMDLYVNALEDLVLRSIIELEREEDDCNFLLANNKLLPEYAVSPFETVNDDVEIVRRFVRSWRTGVYRRKPFPGFHPGIYAELKQIDLAVTNPLVDYIKSGSPEGPWLKEVVNPADVERVERADSYGQVPAAALHIHCFYPEQFVELLRPLHECGVPLDLLISVPSEAVKAQIQNLLKDHSCGSFDILIVPNKGRDIGPLLSGFNQKIISKYDVIGHFHTKKSAAIGDRKITETWYRFLKENLIGGEKSVIPTIVDAFTKDPLLGILYPDDPYIVGWGQNKADAEKLTERIGLKSVTQSNIEFPVGTMFWARTKAIEKLLTADLTWDEYPVEPVPTDGSILHAIERILSLVVGDAGYKSKVLYTPGVIR